MHFSSAVQRFSQSISASYTSSQWSRDRESFVQEPYYYSFKGLLKQIHREFLGWTPDSHIVGSVGQLLGTEQLFRPDVTWASAIQQVGFLVSLVTFPHQHCSFV